MSINIRRAKPEDLENLITWRMEVLRCVFSLSEETPLPELERENRQYYRQTLSTGEHIACFAELDGCVVGCGGLCIQREMPSPENRNGLCGYLMNIYTRKEFRGRGIGTETVSWLIARARERRIEKIYLEASMEGRFLYRKLGFTDMKGYMKLQGLNFRKEE